MRITTGRLVGYLVVFAFLLAAFPAMSFAAPVSIPAFGLNGQAGNDAAFTAAVNHKNLNTPLPAVSSTRFTISENPSPVFPAFTYIPDQAYVIKDSVNYKLYYAGDDFKSINLAQSPDGITWTPYGSNPIITDAQYHSDVKYYSTGFPGANSGTNPSALTMNYRMWYQGLDGYSINGWRYSESPDGIHWFNRIAVTQFGPSVFSAATGVNYGIADVIYTPGAPNTGTDWTFRIYANVQWEYVPYSTSELVVMAFSKNGYDWTGYDPTSAGYATPVFAPTLDNTSFDCDHIGWFKVIKNSPTDWQAFYSGGKGSTWQALNGIGYATSDDGINWIRRQTLLTTSDGVAWRSQSVWMPSVVKTGDNYELFFLGSDDVSDGTWIWWKLGRAGLTPDTTPPTVASTFPTNAATGVPVNSAVAATFSEALDPLTVTTATFLLKQGATAVSGVVTYTGLTATFTPGVNLAYGTVYTATITTGVKDLAGNSLATNYSWNFTSTPNYAAWSDRGIVYTAPATGNAYYPSAIYDLQGFGGTGTKYNMWYSDGGGAVFLIKSSDGVSWGTPTAMTGLGGHANHTQVLYDANSFGLGATGPKYRMWYWDMAADLYSISAIATAESVDGINWTTKTALTQNPAANLVAGGWDRGTYGPVSLVYQPGAANSGADPWSYSYIMYYDGTSGGTEATGLAYSADGFYWTAYSAVPVLPYTGGTIAWDSNYSAIGTVYHDALGFHYWYSGGIGASSEGIGYAFSTDGETWVKNPKHIFHISDGVAYRNERVYTPSVIDDGTGVLKMYYSAKAFGGPKKIGLATLILDTTPPTVTATAPANAATGVAGNVAVTATFSEALNPLTVTAATFILRQGATAVTGAVTYSGVTATFTPGVNLAPGAVYTATITTGVKDLAGNPLANPYVWSFTTASPSTAASEITAGATPVFSATMLGQTSMRATNPAGALTNPMIASSKDGNLTIELARGTKVLRNGLRVMSIDANQVDSPPASDGLEVIVAYEFSPAGTTFNPAPRVTVKYNADKLPENVLGVALARYNDSSKSWEELPAQGVASIGGPVNGAVDHFSKIGVVAKLAPLPEKTVNTNLKPSFIVDKLMVSPAVVKAGEVAGVRVSVANDGNKEGTYPLVLKMDGKQIAGRDVTLAPGQEIAVSFTIRDAAPGKHLIEVAEQNGSLKVDDGFNNIRDLWAQLLKALKLQ